MSKFVYPPDSQRLKAGLAALGLPVSTKATSEFSCPLSCYLYRNPDGSMRWLWPVGAEQPDFLRFYHSSSKRAQLFVWMVRLLFRLKLGHWIAQGRLTLYTTVEGYQLVRRSQLNRWALFTGTAGPNRKLVLWYSTRSDKSYFLKIALAGPARHNLRQEAQALKQLQEKPFLELDTPRLKMYSESVLIQEDMGQANGQQANRLDQMPHGALQELSSRDWHTQPLQQANFWTQARETLWELRITNDARIPVTLLNKLEWLMRMINEQAPVAVAAAHGDFTPWNVLLMENRLCVVDWELYKAELPGLYDLFHFLYQSTTLIGNRGYKAIRQQIDEILSQPEWQLFREQHPIDTDLTEMLYLVHTVTYYLSVYSRQADWHQQVNWLLTTWNDALTYWLNRTRAVSDRQLMLHDLAFWLHQQPHAALKFMPAHLNELPDSSDLDVCLPQSVARQLTRYLRHHPLTRQQLVEHRSFMNQLHIRCRDNSSLHVDLIWKFKRKQWEFMEAEPVWNQATLAYHGLNVPTPQSNKTYIQRFYSLNNAPVPERYWELVEQAERKPSQQELMAELRRMPQNRGWRKLINTLAYGWDTLRSFGFQRGMIVTFSGVDGAGKSTVIEQTKREIEKKLRQRVVVLRHRPSLLPILSAWKYGRQQAEERSVASLPRQGTNAGTVSSLLRFAYYFTDYLLGQFYIQIKYVWRGYIVLYDRYYFDFINDSRRSNLNLPNGLATWLYHVLLKPRLNVFLYASPEEILRRKQELDSETITELTQQYLRLFKRLQERYPNSEYIPVLNQHLPLTLIRIFDRIRIHSFN